MDQLQQRVEALDGEIAALNEAYATVAAGFDATSNTDASIREADRIEARIAACQKQKALAIAASGILLKQQEAEAEAAANEAKKQKQIEARKHADAAAILNQRIDESLRGLADLIAQRNNSLKALIASGGCPNTEWVNKLLGRASLTRAACHAGLARHIDIVAVANTSLCPLASSNAVLASIGIAEPSPAPVVRRSLRSNGDGA
jgi:hypothetical protein